MRIPTWWKPPSSVRRIAVAADIAIVAALPKTGVGKIDKVALRAQAAAQAS